MAGEVQAIAKRARSAALQLAALDTATRNRALEEVRESLVRHQEEIFSANRQDRAEAARLVEKGEMTEALYKRLDLEGDKFTGVLEGIDDVRRLPDPIEQVHYAMRLDSGLDLYQVERPLQRDGRLRNHHD